MSFWTSLRNTVESVASVAGNFILPGSSILTSKLTSRGSQQQLGSTLGRVAQLGSGLAGGYNAMSSAASAATGGGSMAGQVGGYMADLTGMGSAAGWGTAANALGGLAMQGGQAMMGNYLSGGSNPNNPTQGNAAATAADPFAAQRMQYQTALNTLMGGSGSTGAVGGGNAQAQGGMMNIAAGQGGSPGGQLLSQMTQMLQPGNQFKSNDPSYMFRLQQGTDNLNRGAAKSGLLDSGNRLTALQDYGQGSASQEYQNQFARLQSAAGTNLNAQAQQFNQFNTVDQNAQASQQNNYSRLAALSGSGIGSPGTAGQYVQGQIAGAAAQGQQYAGQIMGAASNLWNQATAPAQMNADQLSNMNYTSGLSDTAAASDALSGGWM